MWIDELPEREQVRLTYRYLQQMLVIYFGEDWFDDYDGDETATFADFIRSTNADRRAATLDELDRIASAAQSPEVFERQFAHLSPGHRPDGDITPYRDFADRLAAAIRASFEESAT